MQTPRLVFLDFDGTFAELGDVPDAHVAAVRAARANGHRVFLCTGRPRSGVPDAVVAIGWDGLVCSAGAYVELGGEVVSDIALEPALAARVVEVLDAHGGVYSLEASDANRALPAHLDRIREIFSELDVDADAFADDLGLVAVPTLEGVRFTKATCFEADAPMTRLLAEIGPEVAAVPVSLPGPDRNGGEISLAHITKAVGAALVVDRLGAEREAVVGVGDGRNDLELLEYAGLGVAIEGSAPALIAAADRLAPPPSRDGIAVLFDELGLAPRDSTSASA